MTNIIFQGKLFTYFYPQFVCFPNCIKIKTIFFNSKTINHMRNLMLIRLLIVVALGLLFVQCTSDPVPGPPGADGMDGIDGVDGVDGADGIASCVSCHSDATRDIVDASFELSAHGSGFVFSFTGPRDNCAFAILTSDIRIS